MGGQVHDPESSLLVVLRGNSGSGKTTIAAALQKSMGPGTANIGQDHFRRVVLREHEVPDGHNIGLIAHTVRYCRDIGYHVIVEGMFRASSYRDMLRELLSEHVGPTHLLYLDVPLEETLRRHATRPMAADVAPERLVEWYLPDDRLGLPGEVVLDGTQDLETTLRTMRDLVGAVPPGPPADADRFF